MKGSQTPNTHLAVIVDDGTLQPAAVRVLLRQRRKIAPVKGVGHMGGKAQRSDVVNAKVLKSTLKLYRSQDGKEIG